MANEHSEDIPISYRMNTERILELFTNLKKNTTIMAKITPIDIIKGVSIKFGGGNSKEYFVTNKCSYHIHLAKRVNSSVQVPLILRSSSVHPPFNLRSTSVRAPFNLRSTSVQPPFNLRSTSVQPPFILRSSSVYPSFCSRSVLDRFSIVLRSILVHPSFILRSFSVLRSKIDRRIIEEISENHRRQDGDVTKL